jgi:PAS domain S-box-containing protein
MQQEPSLNENQFEALFKHATISIIVTDHKGHIVNVNSYAELQFGYNESELKDKTVDTLVPPEFRHAHSLHRHAFYHHPSPRKMGEGRDLFAQRKDGSAFPVEISLSNYTLNNEMFVIAFIIDITVRKKQEFIVLEQKTELERITDEIKILNAQLEEKVEARTNMLRETLSALEKSKDELSDALRNEKELGELKSRFVTMASHEFRTPLSTILSSAYLLEKYTEQEPDDKKQKHISRIKNAVADLKNILEDFLSLGKLEEGIIKANEEELTAEECFAEISQAIQEMAPSVKPNQQVILVEEGNSGARLDKHLLKNMLSNLLSNAIKFSSPGSRIEVVAKLQPQGFYLSVKDEGIGIAEEDKEHLFGRFFRGRNAVNIQGTGLGLHIIAKYLELMCGTIEVESALNQGTKFIIFIPKK